MSQERTRKPSGQIDDGLGANTDIGTRLRAFYSAVQDEGIPPNLLDLLEKLDAAETKSVKPARLGE